MIDFIPSIADSDYLMVYNLIFLQVKSMCPLFIVELVVVVRGGGAYKLRAFNFAILGIKNFIALETVAGGHKNQPLMTMNYT